MQFDLKKMNFILGNSKIIRPHLQPFDDLSISFLSDISKLIFSNHELKKYPDLITFAFWCRKSNLVNKNSNYKKQHIKKNLGFVFHVPPSNVPISVAYSFAFGILSGNANIIRISNTKLENIKELIKIIKKILKKKKYIKIRNSNLFLNYEKDFKISENISKQVDARVIWGGDNTIKEFKKMETKISCRDIFFYDKYSICIIDLKKINFNSKLLMKNLIEKFYNDTFIMDQNACSSPHLVFWKNYNVNKTKSFWESLDEYASSRYNLTKELKVYKYFKLNEVLLNSNNIKKRINLKNINVYSLKELNANIVKLRGFAGTFFEYKLYDLKSLSKIFNRKFQTISYYGFEKKELFDYIIRNNLNGVDRIVPLGSAIDLDLIWDGYDIIEELTRIIDIK